MDDNITIQNKFQIFHMFAVHNEEREKQTAQPMWNIPLFAITICIMYYI